MSPPFTSSLPTRASRGLCRPAVYSVSFAVLVSALTARYFITPWVGNGLPFITVFGAIAAVTALGGYRPAIVITVVAYVGCAFMLVEPVGDHFGFAEVGGVVGLLAYLFTSGLIIAFGQAARRATADVSEARELLRVTLRSIGDAVITTDRDGRITVMNPVAELLTGWLERDAAGRPLDAVFRAIHEDSRETIADPAQRAIRERQVVQLPHRTLLLKKDGRELPVDHSASPIRDAEGGVSGAVLVFRDLAESRHSERTQTGERQDALLVPGIPAGTPTDRFVMLAENSNDFIGITDLNGLPLYVNRAGLALVGLDSVDDARQTSLAAFFFPEDQPRIIGEFLPLVSKQGRGETDVRFRNFKTGEARWMAYRVFVLPDAAGRPAAFATVSRDIAERQSVEPTPRLPSGSF
jgi:PAS domain S-box-containing protein